VADERLADLLARLDRELTEADRRYNDALTALDRAVQSMPEVPPPPPAYDDSQVDALNEAWNIVPAPPGGLGGSFKGRLRRMAWHVVEPFFGAQKRFNAQLVDHVNRNLKAHHETRRQAAEVIELLQHHIQGLITFQTHLIQYLQTITLYVDTKDRAVLGQVKVVNAGVSAVADDALKRWESLAVREQRFMARVASLDDVRATATLAQQTALTLKREVERLVAHGVAAQPDQGAHREPAPPPDLEAFKYLGFENAFRGSEDEIRKRMVDYLPRFEHRSDVLDIGCGRGEFLTMLKERGVAARGVDLNHEMVETARSRGLDVTEADALSFLRAQPDGSLGGIFGAQVAEHLEPSYLMALLEASLHTLRPGGLIVLETINPACWAAFFDSYLRDLTHVRALHPDTLQYLVRASGFHDVAIEFRSPVPATAQLGAVPLTPALPPHLADLVETFNANVEKLNARLFTHLDYAVSGTR